MSDAQVIEKGVPPTAQDNVEEIGFKVFAGNLAYSTMEDGLKTFFADFDVLSVQVITRGTNSAGYGFVTLKTEEAAQRAVQMLNKKELDGRQVIVEIAKPADQKDRRERKFFKRRPGRRGGKAVPGEVTEAEANGEALKVEAAVSGTDEAAKSKKKKKKFARKVKARPEVATEAEPGVVTEGEVAPTEPSFDAPVIKRFRRKFRRLPRPVGQDPVGEPSQNMLFVANLGFNIDDEGLLALFIEAGIKAISARIIRMRWGNPRRSKGYGFVDVGNEAEQKKAMEIFQGMEVGGRLVVVKVAVNTSTEDSQDEANPNGITITDTVTATPAV